MRKQEDGLIRRDGALFSSWVKTGVLGGLLSVWSVFAAEGEVCQVLASRPASRFSPQFSFLYWGCAERGLDFAMTVKGSPAFERRHLHQPSFEWSPAFRVFLGFGLPRDGWGIDVGYSFFSKHTVDQVDGSALSVWTSPAAFSGTNLSVRWDHSLAKWKMFANFFDLALSEYFNEGAALSFQSAVGLRGAVFYQGYDLCYRNDTQRSWIRMKNDAFNLGPAFSLSTRWNFISSWSFVGSLTGALLASEFDVRRTESDVDNLGAQNDRFGGDSSSFRPQAGGRFGFLWSFADSDVSYEMAASYEAQVWWKQNMFLRHIDAVNIQGYNLQPVQGDLFFQGLTIDLRLNY